MVRITSPRLSANGRWFCLSVPSHCMSLSMPWIRTRSGTGSCPSAVAAWPARAVTSVPFTASL